MDNKGSTMMEVLVGFTLLMILLASLTHIIKVSTELLFKAKDNINVQSEFNENRYKVDANYEEISGLGISFSVDEEKTAFENNAVPANIELDDICIEKYTDSATNISVFRVKKK